MVGSDEVMYPAAASGTPADCLMGGQGFRRRSYMLVFPASQRGEGTRLEDRSHMLGFGRLDHSAILVCPWEYLEANGEEELELDGAMVGRYFRLYILQV